MRKILFLLMAISLMFPLFAQSLDEKKKQLDELNEQISREQELIRSKEEQKKKKQQDLQNTEKKKTETENKVKKLRSSEQESKQKLDSTIQELKSTSSYLENLTELCQEEVNTLVLAHYQSEIWTEKRFDCKLLASLVEMTSEKIGQIDGKKNSLEKKKASENKQYENVIWSRIVADKKRKEYTSEIASLQTNIQKLERERKQALDRKKELEANAAALDQLIKKLQVEVVKEDFSYEFSTSRLIWPLKGKIIKPFGEQYNEQYKVTTRNDGIDIAAVEGTEVACVEDGVVAFAEWYNGAGKLVIIDHQNGFFTLYSHNSTLLVSKGEAVKKQQPIALSGKTGSAEIPCLHFEIRKRGNPVDPRKYLE